MWHQSDVRPTHRRQAVRYWRTRADPFETVRSRIEQHLSVSPDMGAKELFQKLREECPGQFFDGQIRTLRSSSKAVGERTWQSASSRAQATQGHHQQLPVHIEMTSPRKGTISKWGSAQSPGFNAFAPECCWGRVNGPPFRRPNRRSGSVPGLPCLPLGF